MNFLDWAIPNQEVTYVLDDNYGTYEKSFLKITFGKYFALRSFLTPTGPMATIPFNYRV